MHGYSLFTYSMLSQYIYQTYIAPICRFFTSISKSFLLWICPPSPTPGSIIETVSPTDKYIQLQTARFIKTFSGDSTTDYNSAIDPVFYSQKELAELLKDETNTLEPKWRTKILFEATPRGNIVMFYDAFKQAFAYHTDQTSIPYPVLNAVAMKYVILFRCRDFFVDEHVLPENASSGITSKYAEAEKEKKRANLETKEKTKPLSDNKAAFAKFKSYNSVSSKANGYTPKSSENMSAKSKEEQSAAPKLMNKHISLGKICNFSFIQKPVIKRGPTMESELLPKPRLSYADYKRLSGESLS